MATRAKMQRRSTRCASGMSLQHFLFAGDGARDEKKGPIGHRGDARCSADSRNPGGFVLNDHD